jgi:integrase/recombinase XerD
MLSIYRRHLKSCAHREEGRAYRRCHCPIWVHGSLGDKKIRESLNLRDLQKANEKVHEWEAKNEITPEVAAPITVEAAWEKFLEDATARGLQVDSLRKYRQLKRLMVDFAKQNGLIYLKQFDVEMTRTFRATWTLRNLAAGKRLDYLRAFFRLSQDNGWMTENPAKKLKPPKITTPPTMPFSREDMTAILLAACDSLKVKALVLLMRHSGLRIGDAVSLGADRIHEGKLMLRTAKTGTLVYCPLPPFVLVALEAVKRPNGYFFWTGESKRSSVADTWRKRLAPVFKAAQVLGAHPHRFRDTFAVELLLAGVPLERVSILLGHSSTRITEKHYAPWVRDRQQQLEADVRRTWNAPESETRGTPEVHGKNEFVN